MRGLVKVLVGLALLLFLIYWGQIDFEALGTLTRSPEAVIAAFALAYLTLPLAAWRWALLLRIWLPPLPYSGVFHVTAIGMFGNLFLLGSMGGDAVRMIYARRALGQGTGRIAVSILADRLLGLFALITIAIVAIVINWSRLQSTPALALFTGALIFGIGVAIGGVALLTVPAFMQGLRPYVSRWPQIDARIAQVQDLIKMGRANPRNLWAAFGLALVVQACTVSAVMVIAQALQIGSLTLAGYGFVTPLALLANALPLTPNGLGVGEVAFDRLCHWLEPIPSDGAYSSVFFAFRALGMFVSLTGLASFAIYRSPSAGEVER